MPEGSEAITLSSEDEEALPVAPLAPRPLRPEERYRGLERLGEGGMGEVYRAEDTVRGHPVAIKLLHAHHARARALHGWLLNEARVTARLEHPAIPPIYDIGIWSDDRPFYVMRINRGQTLEAHVAAVHAAAHAPGQEPAWRETADGWSLRRLLDHLERTCEAVAFAHSQGVIHRDLKPLNIMIGEFGETQVIDWGLCWSEGRSPLEPDVQGVLPEHTRGFKGTPAYVGPEQARGLSRPEPSWDVYALGATLYEIIVGRPPASGRDEAGVRWAPPIPLHQAQPLPLEEGLAEICAQAMAMDPALRYPTARELADALRGWLEGAARRARAQALVAEAGALRQTLRGLRQEAREKRGAGRRMLSDLRSYAPIDEKLPAWELEAEAAAITERADLLEAELLRGLGGALAHDPNLSEAHFILADHYQERQAEAEDADDALAARQAEQLLCVHDRGRHARWLEGGGRVTLCTDPPGAEVLAFRYVEQRRRLVPVFERALGVTPLIEAPLPQGSWLLVVRAPGRAEVRYPVLLRRLQHWDGVPPGGAEPWPVYLPQEGEIGLDEVYVPAGWFRAGGDDRAPRAWPAHRRWVDGFALQRLPVTNAAYLRFLNDLAQRGPVDPELPPRERSSTEGELLYAWEDGRFALKTDRDGKLWQPDWPVVHVSWLGAEAYARWFAAQDGRPWSLPWEAAVEKAARGVDGRAWSMGNWLDPTWAFVRDSWGGADRPGVVQDWTGDESPYGAYGLAGNTRTWCADPLEGDRRPARGGSYMSTPDASRSAARWLHTVDTRIESLGLRLARPVGARADERLVVVSG